MRGEDINSILTEVEQVFRERGPPAEFLMDNGKAFRSVAMRSLLSKWCVKPVYRCAYCPSGNGIVERSHRTIKRMAARANADPLDMVFWFNNSPKDGTDERTVPARVLHHYDWRIPIANGFDGMDNGVTNVNWADNKDDKCGNRVAIGDEVFVKPPAVRCTTKWPTGTVTSVDSTTKIGVDGIPRHVADIRPVPGDMNVVAKAEPDTVLHGRPQRERHAPVRYGNNVYDV